MHEKANAPDKILPMERLFLSILRYPKTIETKPKVLRFFFDNVSGILRINIKRQMIPKRRSARKIERHPKKISR